MRVPRSLSVSLVLLTACAQTHFYEPQLTLPRSQASIPAVVRMEKLTDKTPISDHRSEHHSFGRGPSLTDHEWLSSRGSLADLISNAIYEAFRNERVFGVLQWSAEDPDYVLTGTIYRFTGRISQPWTFVLGIVGAPVAEVEATVDIGLTLQDRRGVPVRTYRSTVPLHDRLTLFHSDTWSGKSMLDVGADGLNQTFSAVVQQLRDQLLRDPALAIAVR